MWLFSDIAERFKKNKYDKNKENFNENIWKDLNIKQKKKCIDLFEEEVAIKKGRPPVNVIYENMKMDRYGSYNGDKIGRAHV